MFPTSLGVQDASPLHSQGFGFRLRVRQSITPSLCFCRALGWLKRLTSPVFFSTAEDGVVRPGLSGVPRRRPMLFVGNHQTYALDIGPMVEAIIKECDILPRGLAHPAIWAVCCQQFHSVLLGQGSRILRSSESS